MSNKHDEDKGTNPVRGSIAFALMCASISATAAALLHEPMFLLGGFALFAFFYFWKIRPRMQDYYREQAEQDMSQYDDDATYEPILDRFDETQNDKELIAQYRSWSKGPHDTIVRIRFLQAAILKLIEAGKIYNVEELMGELQHYSEEAGLADRFVAFRRECDRLIANVAQQHLNAQ